MACYQKKEQDSYSEWISTVTLKACTITQVTLIGCLLLCISVIHNYNAAIFHSGLSVYANNVALFREICSSSDFTGGFKWWSDQWQLRLSPPKCETLCISNKRAPITTSWTKSSDNCLVEPSLKSRHDYLSVSLLAI